MFKILIILSGGISSDGISSAWLSLCEAISLNKKYCDSQMQIDFLEIEEVSDKVCVEKFRKKGFVVKSTPIRQSNPLLYLKNLREIIRTERYDIIHVNGSSSFMILEMLAAKSERVNIRIAHSRNTTCNSKLIHKILLYPFNWLTKKRLACGIEAGKWLFGNSSFTVFHNGIDLDRFKFNEKIRNQARKELGLEDDTLAFGHVGKFNFQKNHNFLIHIFNEIVKLNPNSKLFLFGDGDLTEESKKLVSSLGLSDKVIFMGVVNNIDFYLQGLDEMLLPSRFEGLPNVVIEWQAAGLPSVISDSVTKECAVTDLAKFISLNDSYNTWAAIALEFLEKHSDRSVQSEVAIEALKQNGFDIETQANTLLDFYIA